MKNVSKGLGKHTAADLWLKCSSAAS